MFGAFSLLVLSSIPYFWSPFLGISLVFMLLYLWSREYPNATINIYGLVALKAFYLPWAMLCLDVIFGSPIVPDLLGIVAGHLYYFLTVLHPLAGGRNILRTPALIHKLVARWRIGAPVNNVPQPDRTSGVAFRKILSAWWLKVLYQLFSTTGSFIVYVDAHILETAACKNGEHFEPAKSDVCPNLVSE